MIRAFGAEAGAAQLEADEFPGLGVQRCAARHAPFFQLLAVDRVDDTAARKRPENAELARGSCAAVA